MEILTKNLNKLKNLDSNRPLVRVVNGFRIIPVDVPSGFIWYILPNKSEREFWFTKLSLAEEFCHNHVNYHSESFWYRLWVKNPIYHFRNVEKLYDSISYLL